MTKLKRYDKGKDGPAGTALDIEARILSGNLKISYVEAVQLAMMQNPDLAKEYVGKSPGENTRLTENIVKEGTEFDQKCREYMEKTGCTYCDACAEVLREGHIY